MKDLKVGDMVLIDPNFDHEKDGYFWDSFYPLFDKPNTIGKVGVIKYISQSSSFDGNVYSVSIDGKYINYSEKQLIKVEKEVAELFEL